MTADEKAHEQLVAHTRTLKVAELRGKLLELGELEIVGLKKEELVQKLQRREVRLNRQEFLHKVRDIAGDDAPALRQALKQLALERRAGDGSSGGGGLTLGGLDDGPPLGLDAGLAPSSALAAGAARTRIRCRMSVHTHRGLSL